MRFVQILLAALVVWTLPAAAHPALWVAKNGSATVYLFGTIHVLPADAQWMDDAIQKALSASQEIWTEADISNLSKSVSAIRHYGLHADHPTETMLPPRFRARYRQQVELSGLPPALIAQAQPWLVEILLSAAAMQRTGALGLGVEANLMSYAHTHHLSTPNFETLDEQFAMMSDMPKEAQITSLEEQINEWDGAGEQFRALLVAWKSGDVDGLDRLTNQDMRHHDEMVWTELILRRNERFVAKIEDRLQGTGTAFVAVGAAHLCGSTGVPSLLKARGFAVTRIQ